MRLYEKNKTRLLKAKFKTFIFAVVRLMVMIATKVPKEAYSLGAQCKFEKT